MTPSLWAPAADAVDLVVEGDRTPMSPSDGGWWRTDVVLGDGDRYGFSLDGGDPRPDPRGLALPDGPHGLSAVFDTSRFAWSDDGWRGVDLEGAVIYETHVGTFTPEGTLDSAVERLPYLVDLGVTVVELLPLASYPGSHGWGYDGVAPYSVHETYGGPAALQRFVDAAHAHGLAVCLDVVHNHLGPDGNYLAEMGPYFTDRHPTPWGQALNLDGPGSDEVRRWVLDSVRQWLRDFHVDGLRLDAVHELHDETATHLLEEMSREVDELADRTGRTRWLVAESDRNDPRTVTPRGTGDAVGGLGVHGQWADDVHHALHVALTGETQGYYADFADPAALAKVLRTPFFHDGTWSSFRGRRHGRPVDRDHPGLAVRGVAADPRPGGQPCAGRPALRHPGRRRARLRGGRAADLAVDADAVHGRGVGRGHAVAVLHRPHRPRGGEGDGRRPQGRVRRARLGRGRRPRSAGPGDVPPVQARLVRAHARAACPPAGLVPRPARAAPLRARPP